MNSNDLFSFLDDVPMEDGESTERIDVDEIQTFENRTQKKRKANAAAPAPAVHSASNGDEEPGPSIKKPRMVSPKPIVVDDFETEARREVAASAGLTGGVEAGSRLELRHQVRFSAHYSPRLTSVDFRSGIKSQSLQGITTFQSPNTSPLPSLLENTNSL